MKSREYIAHITPPSPREQALPRERSPATTRFLAEGVLDRVGEKPLYRNRDETIAELLTKPTREPVPLFYEIKALVDMIIDNKSQWGSKHDMTLRAELASLITQARQSPESISDPAMSALIDTAQHDILAA